MKTLQDLGKHFNSFTNSHDLESFRIKQSNLIFGFRMKTEQEMEEEFGSNWKRIVLFGWTSAMDDAIVKYGENRVIKTKDLSSAQSIMFTDKGKIKSFYFKGFQYSLDTIKEVIYRNIFCKSCNLIMKLNKNDKCIICDT